MLRAGPISFEDMPGTRGEMNDLDLGRAAS